MVSRAFQKMFIASLYCLMLTCAQCAENNEFVPVHIAVTMSLEYGELPDCIKKDCATVNNYFEIKEGTFWADHYAKMALYRVVKGYYRVCHERNQRTNGFTAALLIKSRDVKNWYQNYLDHDAPGKEVDCSYIEPLQIEVSKANSFDEAVEIMEKKVREHYNIQDKYQ